MFSLIKKAVKKVITKVGVALGILEYKEEVKEVESKEVKLTSTGRFLASTFAIITSIYSILAFKLTYDCFKIVAYTIIAECINCFTLLVQCLSAYLFVLGLGLIALVF